ncbi:MAG: response regulator [Desulfamplus sp.]|nr:response regulator [Desulfamplus sp.]
MGKTILLADDEEDIRDVVSITLSDLGYDVVTAENGQTAFDMFCDINPQIVLTDIKMPIMDGITLLQKIKRHNFDTEVIMITGHGDMELAIRSLKCEATDFITKPINVDALEVALKRASDKILMREKLKEYTQNLEQIIKEKSELQDHLSVLGLMIGSISHSIKGLLTGLDSGLYLLDSGFKKENSQRVAEGWDIVKRMVERIRKMILDILYYAKERDMDLERVNIADFAQETAMVVESKALSEQIEFVKNFDARCSYMKLEIDPPALQSALINILENAVDACIRDTSKKSHQIIFSVREELAAEYQDQKKEECTAEEQDEENKEIISPAELTLNPVQSSGKMKFCRQSIIFEVSDNGTGMDSETVSKIFTLFFSSKGKNGTGFGLFIADRIIRQHNGKIEVRSTPGYGTRFRIRLPLV